MGPRSSSCWNLERPIFDSNSLFLSFFDVALLDLEVILDVATRGRVFLACCFLGV
jgi:hypothetical protein